MTDKCHINDEKGSSMKELVSKSQSLTVNILNTAWFRYIKFVHPHINSEEV